MPARRVDRKPIESRAELFGYLLSPTMAKTRTETDSFGPIDVPADDLTSIMARWVVNR